MQKTFRDFLLSCEKDSPEGDVAGDTLRMEDVKGEKLETPEQLMEWIPSTCNEAKVIAQSIIERWNNVQ